MAATAADEKLAPITSKFLNFSDLNSLSGHRQSWYWAQNKKKINYGSQNINIKGTYQPKHTELDILKE